jgi:CSLREA domain-containing protein
MRTARVIVSLAVSMSAFALAAPAHAATITVTTPVDELNADGDCSLREAVRAANTNAAVDACTSGVTGQDTIVVPAGTYTLAVGPAGDDDAAAGDLDLTETAVVRGAGATTTFVDGADLDRVFDVPTSGFAVEVAGLTIRNGSAASGGGIRTLGTLQLTEATVANNDSGADGAGIHAGTTANVTITDSTISANTSGASGGGLFAEGGTVTIRNSTVSGNLADCSGGGLAFSTGATATVSNVTIADNTADHQPPPNPGCAQADGGGVFVGAGSTVTVSNTLLGDNRDASRGGNPSHHECSGPLASEGYNLIEQPGGCTITGNTTGNVTNRNPQLFALANNGGPTSTHAIRRGSPAVNGGNPAAPGSGGAACEVEDQRGVPRPQGPRCDIGSFERQGEGPGGGGPRCLGRPVTVAGTAGNDTLMGTPGPDSIQARAGNDSISALPRADTVCAGGGADVARGGPGRDRMTGGADNDRLNGGPGADSTSGNAGKDKLRGARGRDQLRGGGGNDLLNGGPGFDVCRGGPGRDRFRGCERRIQ